MNNLFLEDQKEVISSDIFMNFQNICNVRANIIQLIFNIEYYVLCLNMEDKVDTRSSFVSIIGPSNAGKSTLINSIMGKKVSIVTHKVQTTRGIIRAIYTKDKAQLVFLDTPGIFLPKFSLEKRLVGTAWKSMRGIDTIMLIIDATHGVSPNVEKILKKLNDGAVIVINKIDLLEREKLLQIVANISKFYSAFKRIFTISALKNKGVEELKEYLLSEAIEGPWYFDSEDTTDAPLGFTLSEITREKLFLRVHQEIPYSSMVETELMKEENNILIVHQIIYVLSESHKKIVIGKGGSVIKFIREKAMYEMAKTLKRRVNLFVFIKIKPKWQDDKEIMNSVSYL